MIKRRPWLKRILLSLILTPAVIIIMLFCFMYFYGNLKDSQGKPIDWNKIKNNDFKKTSYVLASNDEIIDRFFIENRDPLKENEIPELLADGFVAAEDENFWMHPGIDPIAIARAGAGYLLRWCGIELWPPSGGSTITQQEARLMYTDGIPEFKTREHSLKRKFKEAHFAIQLTRRYSKKQLLTAFLNTPYLGHGANGVAEAWYIYFGEDIRNSKALKKNRIEFIQKIAVVVALNKSAERYCPIFHEPAKSVITPEMAGKQITELERKYKNSLDKEKFRVRDARKRANWVLYQMFEEGYISKKEYQAALFDEEQNLTTLDILKITPLKNSSFGYSGRMAKEMLFGIGLKDEEITHYGGFKVKTCINAGIQKIINEELSQHLAKLNEEVEDRTNPNDGSAVMIEVKTGCIVALTGGHDYAETPYDRAMALRSGGSLFKPFVYATAFEEGKTFNDYINNRPFSMRGANGKIWSPQNFREDHPVPDGLIPLYVGQIRSVNRPTLLLANEIGMGKIATLAHRMGLWGIRGIIKDAHGKIIFRMPGVKDTGDGIVPLLPTAIGASDINLLELANAYAIFFRKGLYLPPKLVLEVRDQDGKVRYKAPELEPFRSVSEETALKELIMMRATTKIGTAKISMHGIEQQVACKTGTSNGPTDLGIACGNPDFVLIIRIGHDIPKPIELPQYMKKVSGRANMQVSGGWVTGPLSRRIWDRIYAEKPKVKFSQKVEAGLQELLSVYPDKYK
ncbi:MAG: transglycosylase domain-containing protein [Candidatus Yanofskybacteria bacterium]|nr:transglycosylase domain-containing protein [Candidatus Yanofskybacteria bacterium]